MSSHIPTSIQDDPLWVTVFWCYNCGKHGHGLTKCNQCSQAYYCDAECQQKHWQTHKGACKAAVAALARHEYRERLARAIRESRHLSLDGAEEDELCVICEGQPVDPSSVNHLPLPTIGLYAVSPLPTCAHFPLASAVPMQSRILQVVHG